MTEVADTFHPILIMDRQCFNRCSDLRCFGDVYFDKKI